MFLSKLNVVRYADVVGAVSRLISIIVVSLEYITEDIYLPSAVSTGIVAVTLWNWHWKTSMASHTPSAELDSTIARPSVMISPKLTNENG